MVNLSDKETELVMAALTNYNGGDNGLIQSIDFDVVQAVTNYKNVNITKAMFRRALAKLKGNAGSSKGKTAMAGSKPKGVAKKTTPSKGGRGRKNKAFSDNAILDENLVEGPGEGPSHDADADIVTGEVEDGGPSAVKDETEHDAEVDVFAGDMEEEGDSVVKHESGNDKEALLE